MPGTYTEKFSIISGMHYFKAHKSPRKVQLKEVHHSNETASVKVMTPDGVTLVQTHEQRRDDKMEKAPPPPPHKRRPAPPPPPKQPPKRPPPPPPPVTPPPEVVVVVSGKESEKAENRGTDHTIDVKAPNQLSSSASSPQLGGVAQPPHVCASSGRSGPSMNDLPLPPPPKSQGTEIMPTTDEPLPPPPENSDVSVQPRTIDSSSLIYPKNSYMSYRSERKIGRQGFDGKYRRSFSTSASSVDLTTLESSFPDGKDGYSPNSWEQSHNIRQRGTTVIFHSNCMRVESHLQKSSSQECVLVEEAVSEKTENISTNQPQESENNQSSISINMQCSNNQDSPQESVPFIPASHEKSASEIQNSSPESHQNDNAKVTSSLNSNDMVMNIDSVNEDSSPLDNSRILTDGSVDGESDTSNLTNVDLNQNAVKNNQSDENNSKIMNGCDQNRTNSGTQTNETPKPRRKHSKTKEEVEYEQLSIDFINHCGDTALKNLLVPSDNYKTISDYMDGLLNLELETGGFPIRKKIAQNNVSNNENKQKDEKRMNNERSNSLVKMKTNQNTEVNENECTEEEIELKKRKEELIQCIEKKVDTLKTEQINIKEEMVQNDLLGQEIANRLQKLAKPNELEKYSLHVEEMEKIVNLLLSLSGRLARTENILKSMPKDSTTDEKKTMEAKREKLREQHEDARRLKESIDRRSNQVSTFLHKYLTDDEYADYDRFIKLKTKLIVDIRELDEKINLGEEQLAALSVVAHLWKSANS